MTFLNNALCEMAECCSDGCLEEDKGCWAKYKRNISRPLVEPVSETIYSGFFL
jgi:hypothetical protein